MFQVIEGPTEALLRSAHHPEAFMGVEAAIAEFEAENTPRLNSNTAYEANMQRRRCERLHSMILQRFRVASRREA